MVARYQPRPRRLRRPALRWSDVCLARARPPACWSDGGCVPCFFHRRLRASVSGASGHARTPVPALRGCALGRDRLFGVWARCTGNRAPSGETEPVEGTPSGSPRRPVRILRDPSPARQGRPGLSQTCDDRRQSTDPVALRGGWAERKRGSLRAASEPDRRAAILRDDTSIGLSEPDKPRTCLPRHSRVAADARTVWNRRGGTTSLAGWSAPCARQTSERIDPKPMGASGRTGWQRPDSATDSPVEQSPEVEEAKDEAVATRTGLRRSNGGRARHSVNAPPSKGGDSFDGEAR